MILWSQGAAALDGGSAQENGWLRSVTIARSNLGLTAREGGSSLKKDGLGETSSIRGLSEPNISLGREMVQTRIVI